MIDNRGALAPADTMQPDIVSVRDIDGNEVRLSVVRSTSGPGTDDGADLISYGDLIIDLATREVEVGQVPIRLTRREFDLLSFMARHPKRVFSKAQLLRNVWSSDTAWQSEATVTEHIRRLRQKLGHSKDSASGIATVWGVGYRFIP